MRDEGWDLDDGVVLREESGNTSGEDIVAEAIINLLFLAALELLPLLLEVEALGVVGIEVFLLDLAPAELPAPLFCHNKALNGLSTALAPLLIIPP